MAERALQMVFKPIITYDMVVHHLPYARDDKIRLPDVWDDGKGLPGATVKYEKKYTEQEDGQVEVKSEVISEVEAVVAETEVKEVKYAWNAPCLMIIFEDGDLNSALHHLVCSLQNPFALDAVATVLVQENIVEELCNRIVDLLQPLDPRVANHPNYLRTLSKLALLKAKIVVGNPDNVPANASPMIVRDVPHHYLGVGPTGIVTMHIFRTPLEATLVYHKESLPIASVSIWNERVSSMYDLVAVINVDTFKINCFDVDMEPIKRTFECRRHSAHMSRGYHYESLLLNDRRKIVIFPVGSIYAN
ncbi:uncharacterized protein LOC117582974 isoform X2 [Drosophila guanche]|uniref:Uncharacterized protein n=1 Tax=Drosophila guanche TaxID=7266 RepID=A0A3B0JKM7_DROGU|nr:uncharacterized protein LOC117582974 isoform X1 [Drosophila guanche]XP_034126987.1 uncharacterized protein LOC117582974 isoform X2 [Drosophila guanche]SPP81363.1 Hypothetical predicted protein [Drosophila guanche]